MTFLFLSQFCVGTRTRFELYNIQTPNPLLFTKQQLILLHIDISFTIHPLIAIGSETSHPLDVNMKYAHNTNILYFGIQKRNNTSQYNSPHTHYSNHHTYRHEYTHTHTCNQHLRTDSRHLSKCGLLFKYSEHRNPTGRRARLE